jgi:hypothetical protein
MKKFPRTSLIAFGILSVGLATTPVLASSHDGEHDRRSAQGAAHGNPVQHGKTPPALAAPVIASCSADDTNATATWGAVDGATKYSVEFVVGYDLTGDDGCADAFLEFEYDAVDPTITVPLTDFDHNFCTEDAPCVASPVSITVRVKGLNPPSGGPKGSGAPQNNPFSDICVVKSDNCAS